MRILPLHAALVEAGAIGLAVVQLGISNAAVLILRADILSDPATMGFLGLLTNMLTTPILLYALVVSQRVVESVDALRSFSIAECGCHDPLDKVALLSLIGDWWAGSEQASTTEERQQMGLHRFQQYVRHDLRLQIKRQTGGMQLSRQGYHAMSLIFLGCFLDFVASESITVLESFCYLTLVLVQSRVLFPLMVWAAGLCARLVNGLVRRGASSFAAAFAVGWVISALFCFVFFSIIAILPNVLSAAAVLFYGDAAAIQLALPADDGFDPTQRKAVKLAMVLFVVLAGGGGIVA